MNAVADDLVVSVESLDPLEREIRATADRIAAQAKINGVEHVRPGATLATVRTLRRLGMRLARLYSIQTNDRELTPRESRTFAIEPDAPGCTEGEHDWQEPYEILGGLKENPGVWGQGAGVIMHSVCMHCGCERVTDTYAQRPDTGEQGLTSVRYEAGKYADEVAQMG
jgi:hypothetical protein